MALTLAMARRDFERVLPRLVAAYESGRLVPFIGSGLSVGACTSWPVMIERLERRAFAQPVLRSTQRAKPIELIERANRAVRALKAGAPEQFERAMRHAVVARRNLIPNSTRALAQVWWPLVLTTNYDNCYIAAFIERSKDELYGVVGRSAEDCQRVLTSLSNPGRALLWALQGHMNVPCRVRGEALRPELESELVVGHEEYRRVTYRDPMFRRAFAEVFRQRSLFFLGAGIRESYLQELFGEVLEIYGPSSRPHYALMPQGEVDSEFMLARFQIRVVEFPKGQFDEVERALRHFVEAIRSRTQRPFAWSFGGVRPGRDSPREGWAALEIERSFLPFERRDGVCTVMPGAGERLGTRDAFEATVERLMHRKEHSARLHEFVGLNIFVTNQGAKAGASSVTAVYDDALALFRLVGRRFKTIHMQLAATMSTARSMRASKALAPAFPPRFVLIQTVRAWRDWRARSPASRCKLVLHVLHESVTMEIAAGRLDVLELLNCEDVRFSTEIVRDDRTIERRVFELPPRTTKLRSVIRQLDLSPKLWTVEVSPSPSLHKHFRSQRRVGSSIDDTLHELGVVPGSTLHFRRSSRDAATRSQLHARTKPAHRKDPP